MAPAKILPEVHKGKTFRVLGNTYRFDEALANAMNSFVKRHNTEASDLDVFDCNEILSAKPIGIDVFVRLTVTEIAMAVFPP